jgi:hypothetical protein
LLLLDGQVHHDTHPIPMGNYVSEVANYLSANPSDLGNYVSADIQAQLVPVMDACLTDISAPGCPRRRVTRIGARAGPVGGGRGQD